MQISLEEVALVNLQKDVELFRLRKLVAKQEAELNRLRAAEEEKDND